MTDDLIERHKKEMLFVEAGYGYGPALAEDMSITILELRARIEELETKLATARPDALEEAAEVCTNIIRNYDVMKPNGTTYEPVHVQRAAKGMVSLARADIRALIAQKDAAQKEAGE